MSPALLFFLKHAMALKATIYKAQIQLADMDRHVYADTAMTIAVSYTHLRAHET